MGATAQVLRELPPMTDPNLLVGADHFDDAGVYRLDDSTALVTTLDFFPPLVDDPYEFGRVAAANSLSDVYAMGGAPLLALNLLGYPPAGAPNEALGEILAGAAEICAEAGCAVGGGHSVRDDEIKFGLSVTGLVHPDRVLRNSTARPGDRLLLTKPLGTGALVAALKKGRVDDAGYAALVTAMTTLNRCGLVLHEHGATAATDVTGFGLTGHALEMARDAGVQFVIETGRLPLLPEAVTLCGEGFTCGGTKSNAGFTGGSIVYADGLDDAVIGLLNDPQTSGGLLIAVPADRRDDLAAAALAHGALCAAEVGEVRAGGAGETPLRFVA